MSADWSDNDRVFMEHALLVAERGRGKVSPNPLVGAVLVKRGRIVGEGVDAVPALIEALKNEAQVL